MPTFARRIITLLLVSLVSTPIGSATESPLLTEIPAFERELMRYVYRWHFDASDLLEKSESVDAIEIWQRDVAVETDQGDKSRFREYVVPIADLHLQAKQANYVIEETGAAVRNAGFRVTEVSYGALERYEREDFAVARYDFATVVRQLSESRFDRVFPDDSLLSAFARAAGPELLHHGEIHSLELSGEQTIYLAPLSPVINEVWVFWADQNCLLRFSSDADLNDAAAWKSGLHQVEILQLPDTVVVVPGEVGASNAYITKDFAGRVLFNCVILGKRLTFSEVDLSRGYGEVVAPDGADSES
jgi:hypothetical protein